jgi:hypothetical protein
VTLDELLAAIALELPDVTAATDGLGAVTWSRGRKAFATLSADGATASFALDDAVAAAATRTPDVAPSSRGPGWVDFTPAELDDHAADRAGAWFASAHRRLGPKD